MVRVVIAAGMLLAGCVQYAPSATQTAPLHAPRISGESTAIPVTPEHAPEESAEARRGRRAGYLLAAGTGLIAGSLLQFLMPFEFCGRGPQAMIALTTIEIGGGAVLSALGAHRLATRPVGSKVVRGPDRVGLPLTFVAVAGASFSTHFLSRYAGCIGLTE